MLQGRIIEFISKIDTSRVLEEVGLWTRSSSTVKKSLARRVERGYRDIAGTACYTDVAPTGYLGAVLFYDLTTLHLFEGNKPETKTLIPS